MTESPEEDVCPVLDPDSIWWNIFWRNGSSVTGSRRMNRIFLGKEGKRAQSPCKVVGVSPSEWPEGGGWMGSEMWLWTASPCLWKLPS